MLTAPRVMATVTAGPARTCMRVMGLTVMAVSVAVTVIIAMMPPADGVINDVVDNRIDRERGRTEAQRADERQQDDAKFGFHSFQF